MNSLASITGIVTQLLTIKIALDSISYHMNHVCRLAMMQVHCFQSILFGKETIKCLMKFIFQASELKMQTVDFNPDFVKRIIGRLEWPVVYEAAETVWNFSAI